MKKKVVEVLNSANTACEPDESKEQRRLSTWRKILFGLAAPPLQMTGNICGFFFSLFLLEVVHMPPAHVSVINFTGRVLDAVTDPMVGQLLFRTKTRRFGRTKPWLMASAPAGSLVFFLMWTHVPLSPTAQFVYYLIVYLLYSTLITCYHVPYASSTVLISANSKDKDGATASRTVFELLFTVLGSALFGFVIRGSRVASKCSSALGNATSALGNATFGLDNATFALDNATFGLDNANEFANGTTEDMIIAERSAYMVAGGATAVIFLLCGLVAVLGIQERVRVVDKRQESLLSNVRAVLTFRPYLLLMLAFLFVSLGIQTVQANLALFATHSINMPGHTMTGIVNVLLVSVAFVPICYVVANRFGKKFVFFVGMTPLVPCLILGTVMPANSAVLLYSLTSISGVSVAVAMLMPWSMLPDVIDAYYLEYGERKEATFYSLYVFFTKFAAGISLGVSQLALAAGSYDSSSSCHQPPSVGVALRLLIGPGPIACVLVSLLLIHLYPIDAKCREQLNRRLRSRRSSKLSIEAPSPIEAQEVESSQPSSQDSSAEADDANVAASNVCLQEITSSDNLLRQQ